MPSLLHTRAILHASLVACALGALASCGGSKEPTPPAIVGTLSISVDPLTVRLPAGGTQVAKVTITRGGGFTGDVTLATSGAPAGVTVTFGTATLAAGVTSTTVNFAVGSGAAQTTLPVQVSVIASGSGVPAVGQAFQFSVILPPSPSATLSVSGGGTATLQAKDTTTVLTATIARIGGFTGDLTLTSDVVPAGVTIVIAPSTIAADATTSTISIRSSTGAAPGSYSLRFGASGTGIATAFVSYSLVITPVPTLSVSVAPKTASITAGGSGSATATLAKGGGFSNAVTLTASGAPSGMTVALTPASLPAGSNVTSIPIAIAVGSGVTAGLYPIVISAAGTGVPTAADTLNVTVTGAVSGSTVTISYCAADAPIWLAYQDGTGSWTRATPNSGTSTYAFPIASGKVGIATVDTVGTGYNMNIVYATTSEANTFNPSHLTDGCVSKTVTGTVANVSRTQFANVTLGAWTTFVSGGGTSYTLTKVRAGPQDLLAARLASNSPRVDKVILRRGLNVANGGNIALIDFNAAEAFSPVSANVTISGVGADTAEFVSFFGGTNGSAGGFIGEFATYLASSGAAPYDALPTAQLASGEIQEIVVGAFAANNGFSDRSAGVLFRAPTDLSLALGPVLSTPTVTRVAGGAYSRVRAQLTTQTEYNTSFYATFSQSSQQRSASIIATSAYLGGGTWDFSIPDLSGAAGWNATWGLLNGNAIGWEVTAFGGFDLFFGAAWVDGGTFQRATITGASPLP